MKFAALTFVDSSLLAHSHVYVAGNCGNQAFPELPGFSAIA